jgi:hypothetical protein
MNALDQWLFEADGGDWADVLRRAGWKDVLARTGRRAPRRTVLAAALLLAVAAPALAIVAVTRTLGADSKVPGPRLTAALQGPDGSSGTFTASAPRTWLTAPRPGLRLPWTFVRTKHGLRRGPSLKLVWKLELRGTSGAVTSVRLERANGTRIATLCAPCRSATAGRTLIPLRRAGFLFNGSASVTVGEGGETLRGDLVLQRRKR